MEGEDGEIRRQRDLRGQKWDRETDERKQRSSGSTMSQLSSQVRFAPVPKH